MVLSLFNSENTVHSHSTIGITEYFFIVWILHDIINK